MDEEEKELLKMLEELASHIIRVDEVPRYWHHDEDFAAFMDAVLEPIDIR